MSRRDVIIISVLINAGLLMVLFIAAIKTDPDEMPSHSDYSIATLEPIPLQPTREIPAPIIPASSPPLDEVDHVLKEYFPDLASTPEPMQENDVEPPKTLPSLPAENEKIVEVTVKSGDALEKIARANRTTVEAIKKLNRLSSDKLKVGQVLKIPVGVAPPPAKPALKQEIAQNSEDEPVYYTVKSGDNPWKIAKMYQVKFEDLLRLNNLDEERAKNLKVGEKIRVK
jgi:peptidoglycan DL-endopeptidase LytF